VKALLALLAAAAATPAFATEGCVLQAGRAYASYRNSTSHTVDLAGGTAVLSFYDADGIFIIAEDVSVSAQQVAPAVTVDLAFEVAPADAASCTIDLP
jgi:hypothetical protein